jgi:hypothetical protein
MIPATSEDLRKWPGMAEGWGANACIPGFNAEHDLEDIRIFCRLCLCLFLQSAAPWALLFDDAPLPSFHHFLAPAPFLSPFIPSFFPFNRLANPPTSHGPTIKEFLFKIGTRG